MPLFLTLLCSFTSISQGIIKKQYSNRSNKGMFTFNAILSFAAMLFFAFRSELLITEPLQYHVPTSVFSCPDAAPIAIPLFQEYI